jgi:hypothetical protein
MYHPIPPQVYVALGFGAVLMLWNIVAGVTWYARRHHH